MKKILQLSMVLLIALFLGACGTEEETNQNTAVNTTNSTQSDEVSEESVRITISKNEGEEYITEEEIPIEEGAILMDVMEENFFIETEMNGAFITSIERVAASEEDKTAWIYTVNGEEAMVGANEYELKPGDKVVFDLQKWE